MGLCCCPCTRVSSNWDRKVLDFGLSWSIWRGNKRRGNGVLAAGGTVFEMALKFSWSTQGNEYVAPVTYISCQRETISNITDLWTNMKQEYRSRGKGCYNKPHNITYSHLGKTSNCGTYLNVGFLHLIKFISVFRILILLQIPCYTWIQQTQSKGCLFVQKFLFKYHTHFAHF